MKQRLVGVALLTLPLVLASCGTSSPSPVATTDGMVAVKLAMGGLTAQGLPTGGFSAATAHLQVKIYTADGTPIAFKAAHPGVFEPSGTGSAFVTLNAASNYSATVLLPKGSYQFESILKDGASAEGSTNVLLGYHRGAATPIDADHTSVRLAVQAVMDPDALRLETNTPVSQLYTNDLLDLRLGVNTHAVGGMTSKVPTTDFEVGAYTATRGEVLSGTASQRGVGVRAVGTAADPSVTVEVPVTALVRDGAADTASPRTVTVRFQRGVNATGLALDAAAPTATIGTTSAYQQQATTLTGTASDDHGVSRARLYRATTLLASTDAADGVTALTFNGTTWSATLTFSELGAHPLTLVVSDPSGNETEVEQAVSVTEQPADGWTLDSQADNGASFYRSVSVDAGQTVTFPSPVLCDGHNVTWSQQWLTNPTYANIQVRQFDGAGSEVPELLSYAWGPVGFYHGNVSWWNPAAVTIRSWAVTNHSGAALTLGAISQCAW